MDQNVQSAFPFEILALIFETTKLFDQFHIAIERLDEQLRGEETFVRQMWVDLLQSGQCDSTVYNLLTGECIEPDTMTIEQFAIISKIERLHR
jgi:hypothetical protein